MQKIISVAARPLHQVDALCLRCLGAFVAGRSSAVTGVGEAQQSGDSMFEGFAGLGGVSEVSGCRCSVAEHDVVPGCGVGLWVAGGGEGVADERVEPGAVGEHGAHDRAVGVLEL